MAELTSKTSEQPPARMHVEYAFKINLGNFSNVDIRGWVEDGPRNGETAAQAWDRIKDFVSERINDEVAEARSIKVD